jgi:hypothetical protein
MRAFLFRIPLPLSFFEQRVIGCAAYCRPSLTNDFACGCAAQLCMCDGMNVCLRRLTALRGAALGQPL